jgi:hypothetical protein
MLFKPNALVYIKCFSTNQSRYIKYEFRERKEIKEGVEYFYIKARYLDFNRKVFGETSSKYTIKKFRRAKAINTLEYSPSNTTRVKSK